jgi:hypothetical protein
VLNSRSGCAVPGERDVTELCGLPELQQAEPSVLVGLLLTPAAFCPIDAVAEIYRKGIADAKAAAVHQPDGCGSVRRQPCGERPHLREGWENEVPLREGAAQPDPRARGLGELLVADGASSKAKNPPEKGRDRLDGL